jgi:hypothetical protein
MLDAPDDRPAITRLLDLIAEAARNESWLTLLPAESKLLDAALRASRHLFQSGEFTLHSGNQSGWKIDCDALTDADLATLARLAADRWGPFGSVEGVPHGGLRFAAALQPYVTEGPLLIVDDVLTTGGSMEVHLAGRDAKGGVIFARVRPAPWIAPLFVLADAALRASQEGRENDPRPSLALRLLPELQAYLDTLTITGDTIGDIRRACFVPWDSQWNGIVRDETAQREKASAPSEGVPPVYSRAEFERDRMGETGDRLGELTRGGTQADLEVSSPPQRTTGDSSPLAPELACEALAFAWGAIADAVGLEDGLDGAAGEKVMALIDAALVANGRQPMGKPTGEDDTAWFRQYLTDRLNALPQPATGVLRATAPEAYGSEGQCRQMRGGRRCVLGRFHDHSMNATPHSYSTVEPERCGICGGPWPCE